MSDLKNMSAYNWQEVVPKKVRVSTVIPVCPWCEQELSTHTGDYDDTCKCGSWSADFDKFHFKRKRTPEDVAAQEKRDKEAYAKRQAEKEEQEKETLRKLLEKYPLEDL
jgi:hypothetical protein